MKTFFRDFSIILTLFSFFICTFAALLGKTIYE